MTSLGEGVEGHIRRHVTGPSCEEGAVLRRAISAHPGRHVNCAGEDYIIVYFIGYTHACYVQIRWGPGREDNKSRHNNGARLRALLVAEKPFVERLCVLSAVKTI